jgi:DNA-binding transcriptional LysR family regulator
MPCASNRICGDGSPSSVEKHLRPTRPQDLTQHDCINLRLPTYGSQQGIREEWPKTKVHVEGGLTFNSVLRLNAALAGLGPAYRAEDQVQMHIAGGPRIRVLADCRPPFFGYHLSYPTLLSEPQAAHSSIRP